MQNSGNTCLCSCAHIKEEDCNTSDMHRKRSTQSSHFHFSFDRLNTALSPLFFLTSSPILWWHLTPRQAMFFWSTSLAVAVAHVVVRRPPFTCTSPITKTPPPQRFKAITACKMSSFHLLPVFLVISRTPPLPVPVRLCLSPGGTVSIPWVLVQHLG